MNSGRLAGVGVIITRPREPAEALAGALESEGAHTFVFPTLAIEGIAPSAQLAAALEALPHAALAIFVSAHAVERGLAAVRRQGGWPAGVRVAAVGEATAEALRQSGFASVISPRDRHDSEALLGLPELQEVDGADIVIFRGQGGREKLRESLQARGARVSYAQCYRRVCPKADPAPLLAAWERGEIHAVSTLSGETLANFVALVGAQGANYFSGTTLVVPHEAVAAGPEARGFARVLVSPHGAEGLIDTLTQLRVLT